MLHNFPHTERDSYANFLGPHSGPHTKTMGVVCGCGKVFEIWLQHHFHLMGIKYTHDGAWRVNGSFLQWVGLRRRRSYNYNLFNHMPILLVC